MPPQPRPFPEPALHPPVFGTAAESQPGVTGTGNGASPGVLGHSSGTTGVVGISLSDDGVQGTSSQAGKSGVAGFNTSSGLGVGGFSKNGAGVEGHSENGPGLAGSSDHGLAGRFQGNVEITGSVVVGGTLSGPKRISAMFCPDRFEVGRANSPNDQVSITSPFAPESKVQLVCTTNQITGSGPVEFGIAAVTNTDANGSPHTTTFANVFDPQAPFGQLKSNLIVDRLSSVTIAGKTFQSVISGQLMMFELVD